MKHIHKWKHKTLKHSKRWYWVCTVEDCNLIELKTQIAMFGCWENDE